LELLALLRLIPNWASQYAFAIGIWFGLHYFLLTPIIFDRLIIPIKNQYIAGFEDRNKYYNRDIVDKPSAFAYVDCIYAKIFYEKRMEITKWSASLGYMEVDINADIVKDKIVEIEASGSCSDHKPKAII